MSHEPHASLSSEVVKSNVGVIHTKRVEEVKDRLGHHRRTSALSPMRRPPTACSIELNNSNHPKHVEIE